MIIHELTHWIGATPASTLIQKTFWLVPTVQTVHLLAIGIVVASGGLLGFRLLGWAGREQPVVDTARRFVPWIWGALAVLAATGAVLIVGEPARTLGNPAFWAKLVSIALALALTLHVQRRLAREPDALDGGAEARWLGGATVLLWVAVVAFGRWIAYILEA